VLVLLAVLALELLALSAYGFARVAQLGARAATLDARLRTRAEAALDQTLAHLHGPALRSLPAGTAWDTTVAAEAGTAVRVWLRRLPHGFVHARAEASRPGVGGAAAAALARVLEPDAVLAAFPAVLSLAAALPPLPVVAPAAPGCGPDALTAPALLPSFTVRAAADTLPLGHAIGVGWGALAAIADARELPTDTASMPQLVALTGSRAITGRAAGLLVVDGDLHLASTAEVRGLLVVRGVLRLSAGARVSGAARVGMLADEGGVVRYDRCAVDVALGVPALTRVYRAGARWRLPAF
jgi:hypothetical protein